MAGADPPRRIVYSTQYERQAKVIEPDAARLDDMIRGAEWALARTPILGAVTVTLNPGGGEPRLELSATVDVDSVDVTGIRPAE